MSAVAEREVLAEVGQQVDARVAAAQALVVQTPEQAQVAVEMLSQIAAARRAGKDAHAFLVKPLKDQAKAIEAKLKETTGPLEEADKLVREKLLAFQQEEERRVAEEHARKDAERRRIEAEAEAERQRQAEEAARVEREAREREQVRQAQLREAANERAREIALMSDDELSATAEGQLGDADAHLADREIAARRAEREARERADAARLAAEQATQASIAAASAPAQRVEETALSAASGSASVRREWKATAIDPTKLPDEYKLIDYARINRKVKSQGADCRIPGVTVEQVAGLSVRVR